MGETYFIFGIFGHEVGHLRKTVHYFFENERQKKVNSLGSNRDACQSEAQKTVYFRHDRPLWLK